MCGGGEGGREGRGEAGGAIFCWEGVLAISGALYSAPDN